MAKNIDSMSNHELVAIAKALAECEMMKVDCANCPCCGVICGIGDIDDCMDAKDTLICELGIRMAEMMNANEKDNFMRCDMANENANKKLAHNCLFGEEYPSIPWGKTIIGCTEDNIWCNDCIAEKCEMYVDKNDSDNN